MAMNHGIEVNDSMKSVPIQDLKPGLVCGIEV